MRVALVLICAFVLTACGCGKKEAPREASNGKMPRGCNEVRIISGDGTQTLMERTDGTKIRFLRDGVFGTSGDLFTFCE